MVGKVSCHIFTLWNRLGRYIVVLLHRRVQSKSLHRGLVVWFGFPTRSYYTVHHRSAGGHQLVLRVVIHILRFKSIIKYEWCEQYYYRKTSRWSYGRGHAVDGKTISQKSPRALIEYDCERNAIGFVNTFCFLGNLKVHRQLTVAMVSFAAAKIWWNYSDDAVSSL